ncbi:MAG: [Fe-Fe] hydrogenase large subunit C-terminal domain-containing protein, partial [Candidatus Aquicultorales bacterium]
MIKVVDMPAVIGRPNEEVGEPGLGIAMLRTIEGRCKECFACIRVCPVKAIRSANGKAEVVADRCVRCGQCVIACKQGALDDSSGIERVRELLAQRRPTVVMLAPEFPASLALAPLAAESLLARAGFYSVEDLILGEEVAAQAYERLLTSREKPIIRSTCPTIVNLVEKYYAPLIPNLSPIETPAAIQAGAVKEVYGDVSVVYAGPCFAM